MDQIKLNSKEISDRLLAKTGLNHEGLHTLPYCSRTKTSHETWTASTSGIATVSFEGQLLKPDRPLSLILLWIQKAQPSYS